MSPKASSPEIKNLMIALLFATVVMMGWQYYYEAPRQAAQQKLEQAQQADKEKTEQTKQAAQPTDEATEVRGPRVMIESDRLHGSLSLTGARIDTLTLANYHETKEKSSPEVALLKTSTDAEAYFIDMGVLADKGVRVPDGTTLWHADRDTLTPDQPVTLTWNNGAGLTFQKIITLDPNYMFTITTQIKNGSGTAVQLYPYATISRNYADVGKHTYIMHEGPLGVANGVLNDVKYKALREDGEQKFDDATGWIGITDKYWLTAVIPQDDMKFDADYKYFKRHDHDAYQVDLRGHAMEVPANGTSNFNMQLFAGAKEVRLLDHYRVENKIPLFDRAVDFGSLYFITKPIFFALDFFHTWIGNFGLAILLLTCCIKLLLFPLANKSFTSMSQMKLLVPQMNELKDRYNDDKMKLNAAVMELYKKEGVNPMSGCLPLLIQIPIFFSLYKVLYSTIEMRHAPFFGWIHDLSAPDPTNIFTLFGLIDWTPPTMLHIGIWPIIMCCSMVVQQKLNPKPQDPVQAQVIGFMPYFFLFMFAKFPAGLVIYWAWNNTLSILQQSLIQRRIKKHGHKKKPMKAKK